MRRTRFMSALFLAWAISFFFVQEFRDGLQLVFAGDFSSWQRLERAIAFSPQQEQLWLRQAEQQRDARTFAFLALHSQEPAAVPARAEQATALDPQLNWIYFTLAMPYRPNEPLRRKAIERLRAWDPQGAASYLAEGQLLYDQQKLNRYLGTQPAALEPLAKETAWLQAMDGAFSAPHYSVYHPQRFALERSWLHERGQDRPLRVVLYVAAYPIPNLLCVRQYADVVVHKYGKEAAAGGRLDEAARHYWKVAHMGQRMQLSGASLIERLIGIALQNIAGEQLIPLLQRQGRKDEASSFELHLAALKQYTRSVSGKDPLAQSTNYFWSALMVTIFAALVFAFSGLTLLCVLYVNAKRWIRPTVRGRLYQILTVGENYAPILLFLACLGSFLSYYPYSRNFQHYMTVTGDFQDLEPLVMNVLPSLIVLPGQFSLPPGNPFLPYAWYALAGLVIVAVGMLLAGRQPAQPDA